MGSPWLRLSGLGLCLLAGIVLAGGPDARPSERGSADGGGVTLYDPALKVTWLADADLVKTQSFGVHGIEPNGSIPTGRRPSR